MNKLVKTVTNDSLIREFLQSLNGILGLTERELQLLTELIKIDLSYVPDGLSSKNVISTKNRKDIIAKLGVTKDNLSRYIRSFKEKGILKLGPAEDEVSVNTVLIPNVIGDRVQITIVLKVKNA